MIGENLGRYHITEALGEGGMAACFMDNMAIGYTLLPDLEGLKVLVVDDNGINRDLLSRYLERQGHAVRVAPNGRQALEMISTGAFDLVLLDIAMPGLTGYEVLQNLKNSATLRDLPVIMISALDEMDLVVR